MADIDPKSVQDILNSLNRVTTVMASTMDMMVEGGRQFEEILERISKKYGDVATDAKASVTYITAARQELSDLVKLVNIVSTKGIFDNKSIGDTKKHLKEILDTAEKVRDSERHSLGDRSKAAQTFKTIEGILKRINNTVGDTSRKMGDAFDKRVLNQFQSAVEDVGISIGSVHTRVEKMRGVWSSLLKGVRDTFGSIRVLGPAMRLVSPPAGGVDIFREKVRRGKKRISGFLRDLPIDEEGNIDTEAIKKMDPTLLEGFRKRARTIANMSTSKPEWQEGMAELSTRGGTAGRFERWRAGKAIQATADKIAAGEEIGAGETAGIGAIAKGGGSWISGAAAGGVEAGGVALGMLELVREAFDSMVEDNKNIYQKMGVSGGGLFAGGTNVGQQFQNIRSNLNIGLNPYGQTRTGNYEIAAAINKFGVSVGELSQWGNDLNKNIVGYAGAAPGKGIATTVFGAARMGGLDTPEATEAVMKVIMRYHQSLESTDDFFNRLLSDTKAAGITTIKYLQIIDEITGGFDHMSRGIDNVTSALRMLGHTGLLTSEQVEDAMKAMMVQNNPMEINTYLLSQAPKDMMQKAAKSWQASTEDQGQIALQATRDAYGSVGKGGQFEGDLATFGITKENIGQLGSGAAIRLQQMLGTITGLPGSAGYRHTAGGAVSELITRLGQLSAMNRAATPGAGMEDMLNLANMAGTKGSRFGTLINEIAYPQALVQAGVGKNREEAFRIMMGGPEVTTQQNLLMREVMKLYNISPEDLQNITNPLRYAAGAEITAAQQGNITEEEAHAVGKYVRGPGGGVLGPSATRQQVMDSLKDNATYTDAIQSMTGSIDAMQDFYDPNSAYAKAKKDEADKQGREQKDKAKDLGEAMTDSAGYLKEIKEFLMGKMFQVIQDAAYFIEHPLDAFGVTGMGPQSAEQAAEQNQGGWLHGWLGNLHGMTPGDLQQEFFPMGGDILKKSIQDDLNKAGEELGNIQKEMVVEQAKTIDQTLTPDQRTAAADRLTALRTQFDPLSKSYTTIQQFKGKIQKGEIKGQDVIAALAGQPGLLDALVKADEKAGFLNSPSLAIPAAGQQGGAPSTPAAQAVKHTEAVASHTTNTTTTSTSYATVNADIHPDKSSVTSTTETVTPSATKQAKQAVEDSKSSKHVITARTD